MFPLRRVLVHVVTNNKHNSTMYTDCTLYKQYVRLTTSAGFVLVVFGIISHYLSNSYNLIKIQRVIAIRLFILA